MEATPELLEVHAAFWVTSFVLPSL